MKNSKQFSNFQVKSILFKEAKAFIKENHYSHTFPAACVNLGAYNRDGHLIGVIVYGMSCQSKMAQSIIPYLRQYDYYELQRLFVHDCTEKNFESWFIGQSILWLKKNRPAIKMLVSFSDTFYGHQGTIYQATNWIYTGMSNPGTVYINTEGTLIHARTLSKGKIDKTKLKKERRPGKNRYVLFLSKTVDVYKNITDNSYIRISELNYWLEKEKLDNIQYIERINGYLKKHKLILANNMNYSTQPYPKETQVS